MRVAGCLLPARRVHVRERAPATLELRTRAWTGGGIVLRLLVASAAGPRSSSIPGGDEPHYLVITQSLLYDGDLKIENNHERGDFFEYIDDPIRAGFLRRGIDGQIYSVHAPGVSALCCRRYAIAGYPRRWSLRRAPHRAGGARRLWRTAFRLTGISSAAWAADGGRGLRRDVLSPQLHDLSRSRSARRAVTVALAVLVTLEIVADGVSRRGTWWLAGAALALSALAAHPLCAGRRAFGFGHRARSSALQARLATALASSVALPRFSMFPAASAVAWLAFFFVIYGTPNPSAPYGDSRQNAFEWLPAGTGRAGLRSAVRAPGERAGAGVCRRCGFIGLWRHAARDWRSSSSPLPSRTCCVVGSFGMWWGGWSAPARFLTCLMPLAVPVRRPLRGLGAGTRLTRSLFVALVAVGDGQRPARASHCLSRGAPLQLPRRVRPAARLGLAHRQSPPGVSQHSSTWHRADAAARIDLAAWPARLALLVAVGHYEPTGDDGWGASWALTSWILAACASGGDGRAVAGVAHSGP